MAGLYCGARRRELLLLNEHIEALGRPVFALNVPFSLATSQPNNATMRRLSPGERAVDLPRALEQWSSLYAHLASQGIVYLVPSHAGLQDLPFVANLGAVLPHEEGVAVVSNFRSEPRRGETAVGLEFFASLGFKTQLAPKFFEGEADLKYLRENVYFGAHGMRTSMDALDWLREAHAMEIVPIRVHDERLYHLDCVIFPITRERVVLCTEAVDAPTLRAIEAVAEVVPVAYDVADRGITNVVRCGDEILCDSLVGRIGKDHPLYDVERRKVEGLERIAADHGLGLRVFELPEFHKSGAMLSCLVLHLHHPLAIQGE